MTRHADAVAIAQDAHNALERLFRRVGSTEHPQGRLWALYRLVRQSLSHGEITVQRIDEIAQALETGVDRLANDVLSDAINLGTDNAAQQLMLWGDRALRPDTASMLGTATAAVLAAVAVQIAQARATVALGDKKLLLGDATRVGLLTPAPIAEALTRMLTTVHQAAFDGSIGQDVLYRKQAVATLSSRTTNCCLQVHGQIQDRDKPFILSGTPHFAGEMMQPPFHRYCRTVTALVRPQEEDDELTRLMRQGARAELKARETGGTTQTKRSGSAIEA